jgi:methyltransferase (TIGR00027 family)
VSGDAPIAAAAPRQARSGWPMITRTKLIDDRIAACLSAGCDRVLNLAAGLDTRPYRLDLPRDLDWIEADLPAMVDEKERQLAGETPRCRLRRERVDLADRAARADFLARATSGATKVLVITEGLLTYLDDDQVRELGRDLLRPPIRWWVLDVASPAIVKMMMRGMGAQLQKAPLKFAPAFFEQLGWRVRDILSIFRSAVRFHRVPCCCGCSRCCPSPTRADPATAAGRRSMDLIFPGALAAQAVYAAARLELADRIADGATTVAQLATATGCKEGTLGRLVRALASVGLLVWAEDGGVELTPSGEMLKKGHPNRPTVGR